MDSLFRRYTGLGLRFRANLLEWFVGSADHGCCGFWRFCLNLRLRAVGLVADRLFLFS